MRSLSFELDRLNPYQQEVFDNVLDGQVQLASVIFHRFLGKSHLIRVLAISAALRLVQKNEYSEILIVAPTKDQARSIHFDDFQRMLKQGTKDGWVTFRPQELEILITLGGNVCRIVMRGSKNAKGQTSVVRGVHAHLILIDEADDVPEEFISKVATPAGMRYRAPILVFGTYCYGASYLEAKHNEYSLRMAEGDDSVYTTKLNWVETNYINDPIIQNLSKNMSEEAVSRELYLDPYSPKDHIYYKEGLKEMRDSGRLDYVTVDGNYPVYAAIDIGVNDYGVVLLFQFNQGTANIIDMEFGRGIGMEGLLARVAQRYPRVQTVFVPCDGKNRDPWSGKREFLYNIQDFVRQTLKGNVAELEKTKNNQDKIVKVRKYLPTLRINRRRCSRLLEEMLVFGPKEGTDRPRHNDFMDALYYAVCGVQDVSERFGQYTEDFYNTRDLYDPVKQGIWSPDMLDGDDTSYDLEE